jgi:acetyl-CoA acetyltransferase
MSVWLDVLRSIGSWCLWISFSFIFLIFIASLSAKFGVSREDQDAFTVRSHVSAAKAHADGFYKNEVLAYKGSTEENGIKGDSTIEKVAKLKPAFVKPHGTYVLYSLYFSSFLRMYFHC